MNQVIGELLDGKMHILESNRVSVVKPCIYGCGNSVYIEYVDIDGKLGQGRRRWVPLETDSNGYIPENPKIHSCKLAPRNRIKDYDHLDFQVNG